MNTYIFHIDMTYPKLHFLIFRKWVDDSIEYATTINEDLDTETWTIDDLMIRYGESRDILKKDYMSKGMPYIKTEKGKYIFNCKDVLIWELNQKYIQKGKNFYTLPAYKELKNHLAKYVRVYIDYGRITNVSISKKEILA